MSETQQKWCDVETIHDEGSGNSILLGSEEAVRAFVAEEYGPDYVICSSGWMHNVGWDRENYRLKREFLAESGFTAWWEGCLPPEDGRETKTCRPAWEAVCNG